MPSTTSAPTDSPLARPLLTPTLAPNSCADREDQNLTQVTGKTCEIAEGRDPIVATKRTDTTVTFNVTQLWHLKSALTWLALAAEFEKSNGNYECM